MSPESVMVMSFDEPVTFVSLIVGLAFTPKHTPRLMMPDPLADADTTAEFDVIDDTEGVVTVNDVEPPPPPMSSSSWISPRV